jgi:SprT protein
MDLEKLWRWGREQLDSHGFTDVELVYSANTGRVLGSWNAAERRIVLSAMHAFRANEVDAKDTVLHEIAHAIAGSDANHGAAWKRVARSIGAKPNRVTDEIATETTDYKVIGTCIEGHVFTRNTMPRAHSVWLCNKGCEHLPSFARRITWRRNVVAVPPEVAAAVRAHGPSKVRPKARVGDRVKLNVPGNSTWDQKVGTVLSIARVNMVVRVDNRPRPLRVSFKAVEPLA